MSPTRIADCTCLILEGPDARGFAQAQFAANIEHLAVRHWQWNVWLTAQGKVRFLMHLADPGDGRLVAVARGGDVDAACAALARYRLRAAVTLAVQTFAGYAGEPMASGVAIPDADSIALGYGERSLVLRPTSSAAGDAVDTTAERIWRLGDVRAGWPSLPDGEPQWLPPALGLEHRGAVAFDKGCYPGQEIAARLHYRGGHKRCLYHLHGSTGLPCGSLHDDTGAPLAVLDCVAAADGFALLVVAANHYSICINILANVYEVVSRFDA